MAKRPSAKPTDPVERTRKYLEAHKELHDVRWYTLLLFNALEETARMYLAWRLSCAEADLPGAANNPSILFDFLVPGDRPVRKKLKLFSEARNAIAHRFHENAYEDKLNQFVRAIDDVDLPKDADARLLALSAAVWRLSIELGGTMQQCVTPRPPTPFPDLTSDLNEDVERTVKRRRR